MLDPAQLRADIIRPALAAIGSDSADAAELILGTIAQESGGQYVRQLGGGPAMGICQMEPATHDDIWGNFLRYRSSLSNSLLAAIGASQRPRAERMVWDLRYAVLMCRAHYLRVPEPLPDTLEGKADYWKQHYNTADGAGTVEEYVRNYRRLVKGA